ncbi:MAG: pentapeptide repeat-containing protein [Candidatus Wallbacteria bacterium]|nr:pentapeptide repeat-containing protein [Candidatus Wallbacteria bacterium]
MSRISVDEDEFERQELLQLLREGDSAGFNARRHQHSYKRIDLSRSELIFAELEGVVLMEADLAESNFSGSNLSNSNLRGAFLSNCDLSGADLRATDLTGADLTFANLTGAQLAGANLLGANLSDALLPGADLTGANLRSADMRRADLRNASLTRADVLTANLEGIRGAPDDFLRIGDTFEQGADRAVKTGSFEEALVLYDGADHFLQQGQHFRKRAELFRKVVRLANTLGIAPDQLHARGTRLLLALAKARADAAASGHQADAEELRRLHDALRQESGVPEEAPANLVAPELRELTRTDLQRHAAVALRLFHRFDVDSLLVRLGELLDSMDETTVLDLSVRFGIPDLQLSRAGETLTAEGEELDRLRGENFLDVLKQRLRATICSENGAVYAAWRKDEVSSLEPLIVILLKELAVPSPFRILAPVLAALIVKSGLARYCNWVATAGRLPIA